MKNRRIDEILKSAFGELDGDLGQLTEVERGELEAMRSVREGLAALKDVPECQLSNERLRDAILSNAVRPRRVSAWSVATAGVACAAIALIAIRGVGGPEKGELVGFNDSTSSVNSIGPDNASAILGDQSKIFTPHSTGGNEAVATGDANDAVAPTDRVVSEPTEPEYHKGMSEFDNLISNPGLGQDPDVAITPVALSGSAERGMVVVVDPNNVTRNGAARATEMDSYSDVVFGG